LIDESLISQATMLSSLAIRSGTRLLQIVCMGFVDWFIMVGSQLITHQHKDKASIMEINQITTLIQDLQERTESLRRYL